jgi:acyl-coenzyme A synthetase/AMP-(fatty) acid ligase
MTTWRFTPRNSPRPEEHILRSAGVADVGVFTMQEPLGVEELWIVVAGWRGSEAELLDRVTRALSTRGTFGRFHVAQVPAIPRTSTGKIQRHLLRRTAERLAR